MLRFIPLDSDDESEVGIKAEPGQEQDPLAGVELPPPSEGSPEASAMACAFCPGQFPRLSSLALHMNSVHALSTGDEFSCYLCNEILTSERCLELHVLRQHVRQKCDYCEQLYTRKGDLIKHIQAVHSDAPELHCPHCLKTFHNKYYVTRHIRTVHLKPKQFVCNQCNKSYSSKHALKQHVRTIHEGRRDFVCDICSKAFQDRTAITVHKRSVHDNIRNFPCSACPKRFKTKKCLLFHMKGVHEKVKDVQCEMCPMRFSLRDTMQVHMKRMHNVKAFSDQTLRIINNKY